MLIWRIEWSKLGLQHIDSNLIEIEVGKNIEAGMRMVTMKKSTNVVITIRKAVKNDAVSIASIHSNTWKVAYKGIVPSEKLDAITYSKRLKYFKDVLGTDLEETVVAEVNGLVVGFMTFGQARDEDLNDQCGEVWGIYMDVSYFNKGIGTRLMEWAEDELLSRGNKYIYLWTLKGNNRSNMFYRSLGYIQDGNSKTILNDEDIKAIRYYKRIDVL